MRKTLALAAILTLAGFQPASANNRPSTTYPDEDFEWCRFIAETRGTDNASYFNFCVWDHPGYDNESPCGGLCDRTGTGETTRPNGGGRN